MTRELSMAQPEKLVTLDPSNIHYFQNQFCAAKKCGRPLQVGDVVVEKVIASKLLGNTRSFQVRHYHKGCFDKWVLKV